VQSTEFTLHYHQKGKKNSKRTKFLSLNKCAGNKYIYLCLSNTKAQGWVTVTQKLQVEDGGIHFQYRHATKDFYSGTVFRSGSKLSIPVVFMCV
jgi:hypothetical protein